MNSFWNRKFPFLVVMFVTPSAIAFADWGYFFPLAAHLDLRFQIVGECIELLILAAIIVLLRVRYWRDTQESGNAPLSIERAAAAGGFFAACTFIFEWRQFFPNDQFRRAGLFEAVLRHLLMGLFFGLFMFPIARSQKPSRGEEKSVV